MKSHSSLPIKGEQGGGLLNLTLPTGWNQCTPEQLEQIIIAQQVAQGNPTAWKLECFLRLTGLTLLEPPDTSLPLEEQTITVRVERLAVSEKRSWWHRLVSFFRRRVVIPLFRYNVIPTSWRRIVNYQLSTINYKLYLWQIHYWIKESLVWLDSAPAIARFPYPTYKYKDREFHAPRTHLSDWTWGQYRLAQDYMEYYFKVAAKIQSTPNTPINPSTLDAAAQARALVLATFYNGRITYIDPDTHMAKTDWRYVSTQSQDNADAFLDFPEVRFQVVLLWWSSVMARLHRLYPKCFKTAEGDKKKKKRRPKTQDPLADYAKLTATLQHITNFDSDRLEHEPHEVILQRLTQMITENEEMEKIRKKK